MIPYYTATYLEQQNRLYLVMKVERLCEDPVTTLIFSWVVHCILITNYKYYNMITICLFAPRPSRWMVKIK